MSLSKPYFKATMKLGKKGTLNCAFMSDLSAWLISTAQTGKYSQSRKTRIMDHRLAKRRQNTMPIVCNAYLALEKQ